MNKHNILLLVIFSFIFSILASCIVTAIQVKAQSGTEDFWVNKIPMPTARFSFGVAVVNGSIYAIGGAVKSQSEILLSVNEKYDPTTETWTEKTPLSAPRYGCAVTEYENKIYVFGGDNNASSNSGTNITEVYDPVTDTWATKASMPTARSMLQANVVNGKIYLIGGRPNGALNEVYDPVTDSWTTKASIPTSGTWYASAVVDSKIYVFSNLTQVYDPQTNTWSSGAPILNPVAGAGVGATTGVEATKAIYVIGGEPIIGDAINIFSPQNFTQIYFPVNNSWRLGTPLSLPTSRLCIAVVNDTLYALGGTRAVLHQGLTDNKQYTPIGYGTPDPTYHAPTPLPPQQSTTIPDSAPIPLVTSSANPSPSLFSTPLATRSPSVLASPTQNPVAPLDASPAASPLVSEQQSEPFSPLATIALLLVVAVSVGFLIYLKKHKH